jgi:hypothetical protein
VLMMLFKESWCCCLTFGVFLRVFGNGVVRLLFKTGKGQRVRRVLQIAYFRTFGFVTYEFEERLRTLRSSWKLEIPKFRT